MTKMTAAEAAICVLEKEGLLQPLVCRVQLLIRFMRP